MRGTYTFYEGGQVVARSNNLITDAGKRHILRYLAGEEQSLAGAIAVGVGTAEPIGSDTRLTYELGRATIYLVSPSYIDNKIIFKATLDETILGNIYEVGSYSTSFGSISSGNVSQTLVSFDGSVEAWNSGSFVTGNQRIGSDSLRLEVAANGTVAAILPSANIDLSAYGNNDRVTIAFFCATPDVSSVRMRLRGEAPANYFELLVSNPMQGYNVRSFLKSALTRTGTPNFAEIDSVEISVSAKSTGLARVDFDGARVEAFSPDIENILVSRSLLATPVLKGLTDMDIEYSIEVNI